jgi:Protein of unknown function (DUF3168)
VIEAGIFNLLSTTAAITAICGERIFPDVLPKAPTQPSLTYHFVGGTQDPTFTTRGMQRWRLEIVAEAPTAAGAIGLRNAVIAALNGYQGMLSDGTFLQNCDFLQLMDAYDHEALIYRRMVEFYLYFT